MSFLELHPPAQKLSLKYRTAVGYFRKARSRLSEWITSVLDYYGNAHAGEGLLKLNGLDF